MSRQIELLVCLITAALLPAQVVERKTITLEGARKLAAAAEAEALKNNWKVAIAVVDEGGHLVYFQRMHEVQTASADIAIQKARSAAAYRRPTKAFQDSLVGGRMAVLRIPGAMPFDGGLPLMVEGQFVGGLGVSGNTSGEQDAIAARAAVERSGFASK